MVFRETVCPSNGVCFITLSARFQSVDFQRVGTHHRMQQVKAKHQTQLWIRDASQDRKSQVHWTLAREDIQRIMGQTNKRLQISDLHFDKFRTPATFACWKMTFKTEECICSPSPTEAVLWIREVELVDSVDDLKYSRSVRGNQELRTSRP